MRAIEAKAFGGPEVLAVREVPDPVAGPGQVVVGVAVVDTLFVETQIRGGEMGGYFDVQPPYVPGGGIAGRVLSTGEGVDPAWTSRRVVAKTGTAGGYAERAAVPVEALVPVPDGLDLPDAAALVHDGVTALGVFEAARVRTGERVLVTGASGGMGFLLVQLAHAAGARVIGTARGARKTDLVRDLGAEAVVDPSEEGWAERVRELTGGAGADVVFDGVGGRVGGEAFGVTARGGRFSAHGAPTGGFAEIDPEEARERGVSLRGIRDVQFAPEEAGRLTVRALAEAAAGRLRPVVGRTFPLERAADAHAAIEARDVVGKTLLVV
ncbi:NADPH:quinone reductase [Planomonospora parontospora subsp. parontospora]|uniref:NADPH:quinone reductase n=2 Tax=Planomonospora parontospora TaxID=58119 RepID=A0AA37BIX8_9ACTN|nr:zinc-binding dehydrogenase [Planomonospora parontospora]GGK75721.1 NADPH:quinone reductase [Planomonospora parontospora]GII09447.1 NADPH:quinone reductase [Planomonospora parontospora subsp. parontospora]